MSSVDKSLVELFEKKVHDDLMAFLHGKGVIDPVAPECPDVEEKWPVIGRAYLPDGVREFSGYPVTSLGWIMFVGMAMAYYWDVDWSSYSHRDDIYESLRSLRGYDNMDEAITGEVLGLSADNADKVTDLVAACASRVYSLLRHEHLEPGSREAFGCYVAALHQLYLAGMAYELNSLGYHMTPAGN